MPFAGLASYPATKRLRRLISTGSSQQLAVATAMFVSLATSVSGDYCCKTPDFGNDNSNPELIFCRQTCRSFVQYKTLQTCIMNETCTELTDDYTQGLALATERLAVSAVCTADSRVCYEGVVCLGGECKGMPNPVSIACELALRKALCAFHFPVCVSDAVVFSNEVCMETCEEVHAYCNFTVNEVTEVPRCANRNFACTSRALPARAPSSPALCLLIALLQVAFLATGRARG
eukprot:CAMPEP_0181327748 /NCGR_PEP_ID=MMETSP1101-20121128/22286_1 /TAXON_ID=46948 /ORGANISM="Rhodomonas abbreviata, Strain Caron Lab Isolate" /LENGTH=232 /DNA_ID=CAMNT_0023436467 /DNA_START=223 /DNA_END=921 /DNA_ORIENTATION=+